MKIKLSLRSSLFVVLLFAGTLVFSASPVQVLQNVAKQMISKLHQNKSQLRRNAVLIHRIVNQTLVPHIDANRMAGMVVGRQYWYSASPSQRRAFVAQFKRVVINTYAKALASYNDDKVTVYPLRGQIRGRVARVRSAIVRKNGQKIQISYNLIKSSGHWKVYDFSIEGVSIVQNYRSQFASALARGGMTELLARLRSYNRRGS